MTAPRAFVLVAIMLIASVASAGNGGWYLLVPPQSAYDKTRTYLEGVQVYDGAPLQYWTQVAAYDTAAECEADRGKHYDAADQRCKALEKSLIEAATKIRLKAQEAFIEERKKNSRLHADYVAG